VKERLAAAVRNNVAWCERVCRSHGVIGQYGDGWWVTLTKAPTHYPDAISLRPDSSPSRLPGIVAERLGASVKDSFASLDLATTGFGVLIEASWISHEPPLAAMAPGWSVVRTAEELAVWVAAHGDAPAIQADLLADLDVRVLVAKVEGRPVAGLIANRTGDVVGVSNVFTVDPGHGWTEAVAAVAACFPGLPLVGWEAGDALAAAKTAGFAELGPLRVWARRVMGS
jgi:hypothetical protein